MYVVKTSKSLHEETPNVNIQFHPDEAKIKIVDEQNCPANKIMPGTTESLSQTTQYELSTERAAIQERSAVSLLRDLNLQKYKTVSILTDKPKEQLPQHTGMKDTDVDAAKGYNVSTMSDQLQYISKATASEAAVDPALQNVFVNSVENVFNSSKKQDTTAAGSDIYHIIELSSNEEAHFDPSSYESIVYVQQVPLETVDASISEQFLDKEANIGQSSVGVQADRNVAMYTEPCTSKYDSSKSKVSTLQKYTLEDIASMGKTASDLIYNYPGRKFPFRPKHSSLPAAEEDSQESFKQEGCETPTDDPCKKITEQSIKSEEKVSFSKSLENSKDPLKPTEVSNSLDSMNKAKESMKHADKANSSECLDKDEFVDENGDCSGCEDTDSSITGNKETGNMESLSLSCGLEKEGEKSGIDKWSHDLGLRRIDINKILRKQDDESNNLTTHRESKRLKNNKSKQVNYKSVIEKGGKDYLKNFRKQYDNDDSGDEVTDMDIEQNYWKDVCKCYHYANKSVIKISPILQSMIKDRVCVIELEVENSLKVSSLQKLGGAHSKEFYYLTIGNSTEEEKQPDTKSKSRKRGSLVIKSDSIKQKPNSKTRKRKRSRNVKADGTEQYATETTELENIPKKNLRFSDGATILGKPKDSTAESIQGPEIMNDEPVFESFDTEEENSATMEDRVNKLEDQKNEVSNEESEESRPQRKSKRISNASYIRKSYSYMNDEIQEETPAEQIANVKDNSKGKNQEKICNPEIKTGKSEIKVKFRQRKRRIGKKHINEKRKAEKEARENDDEKIIVPKKTRPGRSRKIRKYTLLKNENGEKRYQCNFCGLQTETLVTMNGHVFDHTGERPFVCEVCGKSFKRSSNLNSHRFQHGETRAFTCQLCNKGFNDRSSFKTHMRRHIGMKNHVCEECGKRFITSTDKKKHMRGHTGEKPYKCEHCQKTFRDGSSLNRHILTHTKECRFRCGLNTCGRSFTRKDLCVMHIKRSHQNVGDVFVLKIDMNEPMAIKNMNDMDEVVDAIDTIYDERKDVSQGGIEQYSAVSETKDENGSVTVDYS